MFILKELNFIGSWIGLSFSAVCFVRELIENDEGGVVPPPKFERGGCTPPYPPRVHALVTKAQFFHKIKYGLRVHGRSHIRLLLFKFLWLSFVLVLKDDSLAKTPIFLYRVQVNLMVFMYQIWCLFKIPYMYIVYLLSIFWSFSK